MHIVRVAALLEKIELASTIVGVILEPCAYRLGTLGAESKGKDVVFEINGLGFCIAGIVQGRVLIYPCRLGS